MRFCMLEECRGSNIMNDRKTLYIDDLCVDETLRGQHIGRALFEAVKGLRPRPRAAGT